MSRVNVNGSGGGGDEFEELEVFVKENTQLRLEVRQMKKRLEATQTLTSQVKALEDENAQLKALLDEGGTKVAYQEQLIADHFAELPQLRIKFDKLEADMAVKEQELDGKIEDCNELQEEVTYLQMKVDELEPERARAAALQAELTRLRNSVNGNDALRSELDVKVQLLSEMQALHRRDEDYRKEKVKMEEAMETELHARCSRWQQAQSKIKLLRMDVANIAGNALTQQNENAKADIDKIKQTLLRDKKDPRIAENLSFCKDFYRLATDALLGLCDTQLKANDLYVSAVTGIPSRTCTTPRIGAAGSPGGGVDIATDTPRKGESFPATPRVSGFMRMSKGTA